MRGVLTRLGIGWKRAEHWITGPDPGYAKKLKVRARLIAAASGHPDWVVWFRGECRWARLARPDPFTRTASDPLRLGANARDPKGDGLRGGAARHRG